MLGQVKSEAQGGKLPDGCVGLAECCEVIDAFSGDGALRGGAEVYVGGGEKIIKGAIFEEVVFCFSVEVESA